MWEKMKRSKLAVALRNAKSSRAVYVTAITLLLAMAILITATAISNRAKKNADTPTPDTSENNGGTGGEQKPPSGTEQKPSGGGSAIAKPGDTDSSGGNNTKPDDSASSETAKVPELSLPVSGTISKGYDSSIQVFSETMGDYRIHLGLDMVTTEGAPVFAAADGVVSQIWDDPLMGKCLAIEHDGECHTIYKNLNSEFPDDIDVGATVKSGQQIGMVGNTAALELAEEPHLHLEMTVKGLSVNPLEYFSQQALASIQSDQSYEDASNAE